LKKLSLAQSITQSDEQSFDFVAPRRNGLEIAISRDQLSRLNKEIEAEVNQLYALLDEDLGFIDSELSSSPVLDEVDESESCENEDEVATELSGDCWAQSWLSYAFGTVLGRFEIVVPSGLGCGDFPVEVIVEIRKLIDADGIMTSDPNHPQDIVKRVLACLELMLGLDEAHARIRTATGKEGDPEELLRDWIDRLFWKYHLQLYRKRPVYWPLQSPKKKCTV
jgi:hypothetical protein